MEVHKQDLRDVYGHEMETSKLYTDSSWWHTFRVSNHKGIYPVSTVRIVLSYSDFNSYNS